MPEENNQNTNIHEGQKNVAVKKLENSEVEISEEIPADVFESYRGKALKKLGENVEIPGFRKGHAPESVLLQKVGEESVLHEMAEMAISKAYPKLVLENKIDAIGAPEITITKIAQGNPLAYKAKTAVMPEIVLPNYSEVAAGAVFNESEEIVEVTDKEVDDTVQEIRKSWAKIQNEQGAPQSTKAAPQGKNSGSGILGPDGTPLGSQADTHTSPEEVPELTDAFVKKLGNFESVDDFKKKIKENIAEEKKMRAKEKRRMKVMEEIIQKSTINPPEVLIKGELQRMMAEFKGNIASMGLKPEEYFEKLGKDEKKFQEEWRDDAIKRVKTHLIVHTIAQKEHITVGEEELSAHTSQFLSHYKDADPDRVKNYVHGLIVNEKVFQFLEKQASSSGTSGKNNTDAEQPSV